MRWTWMRWTWRMCFHLQDCLPARAKAQGNLGNNRWVCQMEKALDFGGSCPQREAMAPNTPLPFPPQTPWLTEGFSVPHEYNSRAKGDKATRTCHKKAFLPSLLKNNGLNPATSLFYLQNQQIPISPKGSHNSGSIPPPFPPPLHPPLAPFHLRDILFI